MKFLIEGVGYVEEETVGCPYNKSYEDEYRYLVLRVKDTLDDCWENLTDIITEQLKIPEYQKFCIEIIIETEE